MAAYCGNFGRQVDFVKWWTIDCLLYSCSALNWLSISLFDVRTKLWRGVTAAIRWLRTRKVSALSQSSRTISKHPLTLEAQLLTLRASTCAKQSSTLYGASAYPYIAFSCLVVLIVPTELGGNLWQHPCLWSIVLLELSRNCREYSCTRLKVAIFFASLTFIKSQRRYKWRTLLINDNTANDRVASETCPHTLRRSLLRGH